MKAVLVAAALLMVAEQIMAPFARAGGGNAIRFPPRRGAGRLNGQAHSSPLQRCAQQLDHGVWLWLSSDLSLLPEVVFDDDVLSLGRALVVVLGGSRR